MFANESRIINKAFPMITSKKTFDYKSLAAYDANNLFIISTEYGNLPRLRIDVIIRPFYIVSPPFIVKLILIVEMLTCN